LTTDIGIIINLYLPVKCKKYIRDYIV